jgi:hypothetical protein
LEAEISDNGSSSYCWWWCYNNGYEGTSPHSLPQMNSYGLRLLTKSAMNSKYLPLCTQGSVSLSAYTSCVGCSALCWKQFPLKRKLLQVMPLKMDRFVTRKRVSEKCENNINQNPSTSGTKSSKISKNRCTLIINVSSLFQFLCATKINEHRKRAASTERWRTAVLDFNLSLLFRA